MLAWCRRSLIAVAILAASSLFADVNVEWVNNNTVVVSGTGTGGGDGGGSPVIITNVVGVCTNCTAVSPSDANDFLSDVSSALDDVYERLRFILQDCQDIYYILYDDLADIYSFRTFPYPNNLNNGSEFTNYLATVDNAQTRLVNSYSPHPGGSINAITSLRCKNAYNTGIYDYANNFVYPDLERLVGEVNSIEYEANVASDKASNLVERVRAVGVLEPCTNVTDFVGVGSGGTGGGGSSSNCTNTCNCTFVCAWGEEQVEAVLDYLKHIDQDQHARSNQLEQIRFQLGNVTNLLDSYGRAISSALWTDSTIVVDDGQDSWSNVYINGYSSLYDYQRSNVLQRIELLLYGVSMGDVVATNALEGLEEIDQEQIVSDMNDALATLSDNADTAEDDFKTAGDALVDFGESLCFLGDGHISSWTFGKIRVGSWIPGASDEYLEVPSELAATLNSFRPFFRTAFQIVYLLLCVLWCWYFYTRLFKYAVLATRYVFQFLNEAFG